MKTFYIVTMDVWIKYDTFSEARKIAEEDAFNNPGKECLVMVPVSSSEVTKKMVATELSDFNMDDLK